MTLAGIRLSRMAKGSPATCPSTQAVNDVANAYVVTRPPATRRRHCRPVPVRVGRTRPEK